MTAAENKDIVLRFIEGFENGLNMALLEELVAPDYRTKCGDMPYCHAVWPDFSKTVEDIVAEGEEVWVRFTTRGTHTGTPFQGLPATGRSFEMGEICIYRLKDGQIVHKRALADGLTMFQQLGIIPPLDELVAKAKGETGQS